MEKKKSIYYKSTWDYKKILPKIRCFIEDGFVIDLTKILEDCDKTESGYLDMRGFDFSNLFSSQSAIDTLLKEYKDEENLKTHLSKNGWSEYAINSFISQSKSQPITKSYHGVFIIRLGYKQKIDFSYSESKFATEINENLDDCIFEDCKHNIDFKGELTHCIFRNYKTGCPYIGSSNYNTKCTFDNIIRGNTSYLSFKPNVTYQSCKFLHTHFKVVSLHGTVFDNCVFDCTMEGEGIRPIEIPDFLDELKYRFSLGLGAIFFNGKIIPVKFINCDLSKLKLKNLKISKGIKFIGCTFKENEFLR